ncbi:hypothetical protein BT96DRAFT_955518 [Gymnopus androsaceus JB14]|uniref:NAD(P)-binding protein n=1 Tax=Gymnopus androsaceus JB14 TaxID=1447944 RepID=A0A6A4I7P5_9AGAR|nr:hypothetical protein BT96DRAFT_955518 [Gymnopus androsaceus JB14]
MLELISTGCSVAVFVGGTSGIGREWQRLSLVPRMATHIIIIIGRNSSAAEAIIAGFLRPTSPSAKHEFLACDVTLMKNVQRTTQELLSRTSRINFLVMSPGFLTLSGRDETEEGINKLLAMFIHGLVPALVQAKEAGEDAKVFSVLAAGKGGKVNLEDLGLKKTFSFSNVFLETPTYTDLMMQFSYTISNRSEYASRYPSLTFCHACPGLVSSKYTLLMIH